MSQTEHNAYFTSMVLHAAAVGAIVIAAYASGFSKPEGPKVLELVAGAGNNYAATEAPALGNGGVGVKVNIPDIPQPKPEPTPPIQPQAETQPVPPSAITPVPVSKPASRPVKKPVTAKAPPKPVSPEDLHLDKDFKRIENKRAANLMKKYEVQKAALEKRMEAEEIARLKSARVDAEGIAGGVVGGSAENKTGGAGGKALAREEADLLSAYFAMLEARVKQNHVSPDGVSDSLACKVSFYVSADGTISRVRITHSSGNSEFDQSVIDAFEKTGNVGPRPDHRGDEESLTFNMREEDNG